MMWLTRRNEEIVASAPLLGSPSPHVHVFSANASASAVSAVAPRASHAVPPVGLWSAPPRGGPLLPTGLLVLS